MCFVLKPFLLIHIIHLLPLTIEEFCYCLGIFFQFSVLMSAYTQHNKTYTSVHLPVLYTFDV